MPKHAVLILSSRNSSRTQMAAALLRAHAAPFVEVESAGLAPASEVHPMAVKVMREVGLDISEEKPKNVRRFIHQDWDDVITLCPRSAIARPALRGSPAHIHWCIFDPQSVSGSEEEQLDVYRQVRDDLQRVFKPYARGIMRLVGASQVGTV